ncbi:MAG TPA: hypothetical protein VF656_07085 [Pyrinomonadaceae bacterium]|jgi:hypothetical protein
MPRRHTSHYISHAHLCERILTLLAILSAAIVVFTNDAAAQSNYPTKLGVSSEQRTVGVGQRTELRIRLLDQAGNETAATYDTNVQIIATRQRDIDTAKREGKGSASVQRRGTLALPHGVNTVQTVLTISQGRSAAVLQFSSEQAGPIRIYAENEKLVAGALLIAVVERTGKATSPRDGGGGATNAAAALFRLASFQDVPRRAAARTTTAAAATVSAAQYQLQLEPVGEGGTPELNADKEYVRKFSVMLLKVGGTYDKAPQDIEVRLRSLSDAGKLSHTAIVIPKNNYMYPSDIEVRTKKGGHIEVAAMPVGGSVAVQAAPNIVLNFPTTIRATKLQVQAIPLAAMANGVEAIKLRIRPVDAGNNPVRNEDENLEVRNISLSLASRTLGLRFENGATTIPIKKGEAFIETSIISSCPVAGAKVVAEAENGDHHIISGEQQLEFCFPWTQLGGAMFGGLMFPLVLMVFPGKQREQRFANGRLRMISIYVLTGLFLGALAFALVFFGALGLTEFNFNGIPIIIARLPIHNVLAACAIGFFGGVVLASGIAVKEHLQAASVTGDAPAQA